MKLKFDPNLEFQKNAIQSVVNLFEGQPYGQTGFTINNSESDFFQKIGVANNLILNDAQLLANTHTIQNKNNISQVESLKGRNFSVEMETGTGKTYVYLRTIFELHKYYEFKKFIIIVPSVAIREGVIKSIEIMRDHFSSLYNKVPFESYLYDSNKLNYIRNFRNSSNIQIMVINIQAFQKDIPEEEDIENYKEEQLKKINLIYRDNDRMGGPPIDFIKSTKPILIIDEPQSVDTTEKSHRAILHLNPSIILRYSATHRNPYNLIYKLGPVEAYDQCLVKRIEVASIHDEDDYSNAYVKYIRGSNANNKIRAELEIYKNTKSGIKLSRVQVKQFDDLYHKSGEHLPYRQGFIINHIDISEHHGAVKFSRGLEITIGKSIGGNNEDIMKMMVRETIAQHLKKEISMKKYGVKILSLFFIDQVANYRVYNKDGSRGLGKIGRWFEQYYKELIKEPKYQGITPFKAEEVHNGYFSKDRKGKLKDTKGFTKNDEDTYSLIMRNKERLLDVNEPLRFIFSHTALREGWDNPNIFQICTMREIGSDIERRQQIGRGLRLPVNQKGERIHDAGLNRLTIISSEGYEEYANALQKEYEEDLGIKFGFIEKHHFSIIVRKNPKGEEETIGQENSRKIWNELKINGYINDEGKVLDAFNPNSEEFSLEISPEFEDIAESITDEMKKYILKNRIVNAKKKKEIIFKKQVYLREDFRELWASISQKTRYKVFFKTHELISHAIEKIKDMKKTNPIKIMADKTVLDFNKAGIQSRVTSNPEIYREVKPKNFPNIIAYLQEKTGLTRHTLVKILKDSNRLEEFFRNPYLFMDNIAFEINRTMKNLMLKGIQYKKIDNNFWEMQRIERDAESTITRYMKSIYEVRNEGKTIYDSIEFDSEVEKKFARDLDNNEHVKLFVKLPSWFRVDTPIGSYNPDWAFVTEREEKLYFVRETKGTLDSEKRRLEENQKINCGHRHFQEIGVDFDVVTSLKEVDF